MAGHHKGGEVPPKDPAPQQYRIQRLLPPWTHSMGESCVHALSHFSVDIDTVLNVMSPFQLVMEYCLGSASDLLEGEKTSFYSSRRRPRLSEFTWKKRARLSWCWFTSVALFFPPLQFIKNLYKKLRLQPSHTVRCRGWPTFIPTIWSTGERAAV